ncbi:MAG: SDR family oxidoreductase [Pirellulaceae bacterium]
MALGCLATRGAPAYAASKAGQLALGQMLALELAPRRIRVNVICPGAIESNIHEKTERENLSSIETPVEFPKGKIPLTGMVKWVLLSKLPSYCVSRQRRG